MRYPAGSDAMGLLATLLTGGRPGHARILSWLRNAGRIAAAPSHSHRALLHPFGWARESVIFLCMQTLDGHIDMRLRRRWFWPFRKILVSHGTQVPTFIPQANEFARTGRQPDRRHAHEHGDRDPVRRARHRPHSGRLPHGARPPPNGVVDHRNRVFGYRNMYICDGSVIAANLGVNPSLTICAVTERAMSFIPPADRNPGLSKVRVRWLKAG